MFSGAFDPAALQLAVQRTLADSPDIPEGARGAFLTVANQQGIKAVIAIKVAEGWLVQASVSDRWTDPDQVEFGVRLHGTW
jgi:hypothetical protein